MTSLAERAHAAALFIRYTTALSPHHTDRGEEHARTAVRLAAALGLGLDQITTAPDRLRRLTAEGAPVLATATCPDTNQTYVFLVRFPAYDDAAFELLGPCPECSGQVPLALVRHLADLGDYLAREPLTPQALADRAQVPVTFRTDEGHTPTCRQHRNL